MWWDFYYVECHLLQLSTESCLFPSFFIWAYFFYLVYIISLHVFGFCSYSLDKDNRQLKTDLYNVKNELTEYQLKCEQLDIENKQIEKEKNDVLETYAMSWGHRNAKQKINYTGKLIKDIDSINQVI